MSTYLFILGKHPRLSVAEIHMRYKDARFSMISDEFAIAEINKEIDQDEFDKLGGSVKCARIIKESGRDDLTENLSDTLFSYYKDTKLDYGLSVYGYPESQLRMILMKLKKKLRSDGIKSRFINNQFKNISAAQYKSIKKNGIELIIVKKDKEFLIGSVVGVQDIDAYSKRDYEKPFRDMQMGMLPPKLAQILINLVGLDGKIWDPFCGSGTLVMEGLLMGRAMTGTDINPGYIEGAKSNVAWLKKVFGIASDAKLSVHDATEPFKEDFDAIAFEGDLGIPHNQYIKQDRLEGIIAGLDDLYIRFFQNLKDMGFRAPVVAALPFFRLNGGGERDMGKTVEKIKKMGFESTPLLPESTGADRYCLKYARADQAVGRAVYRFIPV